MSAPQGKVIHSAPRRAAAYSATAAVLGILAVLGIVRADELDAEVIVDTVFELIAVGALIMARVNVWLKKPSFAPPSH